MDLASLTQTLLPLLQSPSGAVAFVPLYALWVTLLLPGIWASMLAGALYGTWWGSLVVFIGACLGAEAAFLLGRHGLRNWARARLAATPKLLAIEQAVSASISTPVRSTVSTWVSISTNESSMRKFT